jgi:hypothetical protein
LRKSISFDDETFDKRRQSQRRRSPQSRGKAVMSTDPDPFEQGQRAARDNIPAEANPYADGSEQHALWAAGHEQIAGNIEADEQEGG